MKNATGKVNQDNQYPEQIKSQSFEFKKNLSTYDLPTTNLKLQTC